MDKKPINMTIAKYDAGTEDRWELAYEAQRALMEELKKPCKECEEQRIIDCPICLTDYLKHFGLE